MAGGGFWAAAALDEGLAADTLAKLVQVSNRASPPPDGVAVEGRQRNSSMPDFLEDDRGL